MDIKAHFPLTTRILTALGMLEGRGIIPTMLTILIAVICSVFLIYRGGYLGWAILMVGIVLFVLNYPRRKKQFKTIKRKYGITINAPLSLEDLTQLLLDFNQNSDTVLGIRDYTFIKIDGSLFPLVFGSVSYGKIQTEAASDTILAVFLLVQGSEFSDFRLKYQDVFELGAYQKEMSVYWVKDLQKLIAILRNIDGLTSGSRRA